MIDWWREAGVDCIIDEQPRNWLRPAKPAADLRAEPDPEAAAAPETIEALTQHLLTAEFASLGVQRLAPAGDPASGVMLIADMPDPGDTEAGEIFSGETGRLFDRMLAAVGRDRASVYLATIAPSRPAGRLDPTAAAALTALALRHIRLAQPRLVLLIGQPACAALLGESLAAARGRIHSLDLDGASVPAVVTFSPRYLLKQSAAKAEAWKDLRLMLEESSR